MDKPSSKKVGVGRFEGKNRSARYDPWPGSLAWYKKNLHPEKLARVKAAIMKTGGYNDRDAEWIMTLIFRWQESPLAKMDFKTSEKLEPRAG